MTKQGNHPLYVAERPKVHLCDVREMLSNLNRELSSGSEDQGSNFISLSILDQTVHKRDSESQSFTGPSFCCAENIQSRSSGYAHIIAE